MTTTCIRISESVTWGCSVKKVFSKISQNSQENTCARVSVLIKLQTLGNFLRQEALPQVFSYEFCEICKNTFFIEYLRWLLFVNILSFRLSSVTSKVSVATLSMYSFDGKGMNNHRCSSNPWNTLPSKQVHKVNNRNPVNKMWNLLKVNTRDCVSLSKACNMSKTLSKCFSGVLWTWSFFTVKLLFSQFLFWCLYCQF